MKYLILFLCCFISLFACNSDGDDSGVYPIAKFEVSQQNPFVGETITFDGSMSSDPDNNNLSYSWKVEPGNSVVGSNTTIVDNNAMITEMNFDTYGTYTVILTVNNGRNSDTYSKKIKIRYRKASGIDASKSYILYTPAVDGYSVQCRYEHNLWDSLQSPTDHQQVFFDIVHVESGATHSWTHHYYEKIYSGTYNTQQLYPGVLPENLPPTIDLVGTISEEELAKTSRVDSQPWYRNSVGDAVLSDYTVFIEYIDR